MMFNSDDIEHLVKAMLYVVPLIITLSTLFNKKEALRKLQFGYPALFNYTSSISSLITFTLSIAYVNTIMKITYGIGMLISTISLIILFDLAYTRRSSWLKKKATIGMILYILFMSGLTFEMTRMAIDNQYFKVSGTARWATVQSFNRIPVYIYDSLNNNLILSSKTDNNGSFTVYMSPSIAKSATEVRLGACSQLGNNWAFLDIDIKGDGRQYQFPKIFLINGMEKK